VFARSILNHKGKKYIRQTRDIEKFVLDVSFMRYARMKCPEMWSHNYCSLYRCYWYINSRDKIFNETLWIIGIGLGLPFWNRSFCVFFRAPSVRAKYEFVSRGPGNTTLRLWYIIFTKFHYKSLRMCINTHVNYIAAHDNNGCLNMLTSFYRKWRNIIVLLKLIFGFCLCVSFFLLRDKFVPQIAVLDI